jgi:hypothetical protein
MAQTGSYAQRSTARALAMRTANCSASFGGSSGSTGGTLAGVAVALKSIAWSEFCDGNTIYGELSRP